MMNELMVKHGLIGKAETMDSPDYILKGVELVATSDSVIITEVTNVFDLAGWFIHRVWKAKLTDFRVY